MDNEDHTKQTARAVGQGVRPHRNVRSHAIDTRTTQLLIPVQLQALNNYTVDVIELLMFLVNIYRASRGLA